MSYLSHLPLACPIDGLALRLDGASLRCDNNHSFDIAKQGYVNLLPVQFKSSKQPGDSRAMVQARQRVLDSGLFGGVADVVSDCVMHGLDGQDGNHRLIVDAGCGDGYYLCHMQRRIDKRAPSSPTKFLCLDISKDAIVAAARRGKGLDVGWVVATNKCFPVVHGEVGVIVCGFGFPVWEHWAAIQISGQRVVTFDPCAKHLIELREHIYPSVEMKSSEPSAQAKSCGYKLGNEQRVQYTVDKVDRTQVMDVLEMTPHGRRLSEEARQRIQAVDALALTVDIVVRTYILQ